VHTLLFELRITGLLAEKAPEGALKKNERPLGLSPHVNCRFHSDNPQFQVKRATPQA